MKLPDAIMMVTMTISFSGLAFLLVHFFVRLGSSAFSDRFKINTNIEKALPGFLDRVCSDLSAGRSLQQSLEAITQEPSHPLHGVIQEVFELVRANHSLTEALETTGMGIKSSPVRLSLVSMALSTRSGGNISEALRTLSRLCQDREKVRQRVRSQSAQARTQGAVLIIVPILFLVALLIVSPRSLVTVIQSTTGKGLLALAAILHATGAVSIFRMIRPEQW